MCQYWKERFIGWIVGRLNAKTLAAESLLNSSVFMESDKIFFRRPFHINDEGYSALAEAGGFELLGPKRRVCPLVQSAALRRVRKLFGEYLLRKYEGVSVDAVKNLTNDIRDWKGYSRVKFLCGSGIQIAGTFWNLVEETKRNPMNRPQEFVAVEMDATETEADVYYGRILRLMEIDLRPPNGRLPPTEMHCRHRVACIDWALHLQKGDQDQVYADGRRTAVFSRATVEDISIITRLIGVVEHNAPSSYASTQGNSRTTSGRSRRRSYVIDDNVRLDKILKPALRADDGVIRTLRGFMQE